MPTPTEPPQLANPNIGMDNFITGLQEAGMAEAVESAKNGEEVIAPAEPAPKKEAAPAPAKPAEPAKETPKETPKAAPETPKQPENEDDKWPRSAKDWEARKAAEKKRLEAKEQELLAIRTERDAIKAEIEKLKGGGPSPELEALRKEKAELDEQLKLVSVQNHPKFKAYFEKRVNEQIALAKNIFGPEKADEISALLLAPDNPIKFQQLKELADTLHPLDQSRLGSVLNSLSAIQAEREGEIAKARDNYETIQKQNKEAEETRQRSFHKAFDDSVKSATDPKAGNPAFQKREGDDAWNKGVDERIETARAILFGGQPTEKVIRSALDAVAYPEVLKQLSSQLQENESLRKQISELQSATPRVEAGKSTDVTTSTTPAVPQNRPGHTDPMSAVGNWMNVINQPAE